MAAAYSKADALRSAFHDKGVELVNAQIDLNNGLLGLGIVALGLAVGKVHKDSFSAIAFGAAGAYSFGQLGISKPRQLVYFQAVDAVNCALKAVSPLDISPDSLKALQGRRQPLEGAITALVQAMQALQGQGGANSTVLLPARTSLLGGQQMVAELDGLPERADKSARDLSLALDEIAAKVNTLAAGTVAESGAVVQILASLGDIAPRFAPGLGLDTAFKPKGSITSQSLMSGGAKDDRQLATLAQLEAAVQAATQVLELQRQSVDEGLKPYRGHAQADALRGCGVADLAVALKADISSLNFSGKTDETQTVRISGGVKPYVVRLRESPAAGVEVRPPLPGDSSVEVHVPAKTATVDRTLLILDRADPPHQLELPIRVQGGAAAPGAESLGAAGSAALVKDKLERLILAPQPALVLADGHSYTLKAAAGAPESLVVTMTCQKRVGVAALDSQTAFLARARVVTGLTMSTDSDWAGIKFQGAEKCLVKP